MLSSSVTVLEVRDLACQRGAVTLRADHATFDAGGFHLLVGAADSGHELLLRVLGLLEVPEAGEVFIEEIGRASCRERVSVLV